MGLPVSRMYSILRRFVFRWSRPRSKQIMVISTVHCLTRLDYPKDSGTIGPSSKLLVPKYWLRLTSLQAVFFQFAERYQRFLLVFVSNPWPKRKLEVRGWNPSWLGIIKTSNQGACVCVRMTFTTMTCLGRSCHHFRKKITSLVWIRSHVTFTRWWTMVRLTKGRWDFEHK